MSMAFQMIGMTSPWSEIVPAAPATARLRDCSEEEHNGFRGDPLVSKRLDNPIGDGWSCGQINREKMDEGLFYGLFFLGIIINYTVKLNLESKGKRLERSNLREGMIMGVSVYLLYQTLLFPEIPTQAKAIDTILGLAALVAGAVFFIKGKAKT
jgi:hypothetical protein